MITGLCRAYTDYIISLSSAELETLDCDKGASKEINSTRLYEILEQWEGSWLPGGPVANALDMVASLGGSAGFIGKTSNDDAGEVFRNAFRKSGVHYVTPSSNKQDNHASGVCICFVTKEDAERSFMFCKGVVDLITENDLTANAEILSKTTILFASHYMKYAPLSALVKKALAMTNGARLATSLQTINTECSNPDVICKDYIELSDIMLGNREEWAFLLAHSDFQTIDELSRHYPDRVYVQTLNSEGAAIYQNGAMTLVSSQSPDKIVNTTGAGDGFAGGFLHALEQGKSLKECGECGAAAAAHILQHYGGRPVSDTDTESLAAL